MSQLPAKGAAVDVTYGAFDDDQEAAIEVQHPLQSSSHPLKQYFMSELEKQRAVLSQLKAWHNWDDARHESLRHFLLDLFRLTRRPKCPQNNELLSLARYYFPVRAEQKATICDFGDGRFETFEQTLPDINASM